MARLPQAVNLWVVHLQAGLKSCHRFVEHEQPHEQCPVRVRRQKQKRPIGVHIEAFPAALGGGEDVDGRVEPLVEARLEAAAHMPNRHLEALPGIAQVGDGLSARFAGLARGGDRDTLEERLAGREPPVAREPELLVDRMAAGVHSHVFALFLEAVAAHVP